MYIKPPAINQVKNIIKYANISLNTSLTTIKALNEEAKRNKIIHRVIIMIELGELREGVLRENILSFYEEIFKLKNIKVIGIGTNLGCMYGIEPTYDKLMQLSLYEKLIETTFNQTIELNSGGSSITLPLIKKNKIPNEINHFRVGEAALLGKSPLNNKRFMNLSTKTFEFNAEIIELYKKEINPDGVIGEGGIGNVVDIKPLAVTNKSYRALVDFGQIDVSSEKMEPSDKSVKFIGTTSDMTVYNIGNKSGKYNVGKTIDFFPNYSAVAQLMNSKYITKKIK